MSWSDPDVTFDLDSVTLNINKLSRTNGLEIFRTSEPKGQKWSNLAGIFLLQSCGSTWLPLNMTFGLNPRITQTLRHQHLWCFFLNITVSNIKTFLQIKIKFTNKISMVFHSTILVILLLNISTPKSLFCIGKKTFQVF